MEFEYKTVGGPERPARKKGKRTLSDRVAVAMQALIRAEAEQGWEYVRTDLVPMEDRPGFFSRKRVVHCAVLVFRRPRAAKPQESRSTLSAKAARVFGLAPREGAPKPRGRAAPEPQPRAEPATPRMPPPSAPPAPPRAPAPVPARAETPPTPEQLQAAVARPRPPEPAPTRTDPGLPPGIADYQPPPLPGWEPTVPTEPQPTQATTIGQPPAPRPPQATTIAPAPQATGLFTRMHPPQRPVPPQGNGSG